VLEALLAATALSMVTILLAGYISDLIGRKRMYLIGAVWMGIFGFVYTSWAARSSASSPRPSCRTTPTATSRTSTPKAQRIPPTSRCDDDSHRLSADQNRYRDHHRGGFQRPDPALGVDEPDQRHRADDEDDEIRPQFDPSSSSHGDPLA
jgi:hypothetical protein